MGEGGLIGTWVFVRAGGGAPAKEVAGQGPHSAHPAGWRDVTWVRAHTAAVY